MHGTILSTYSTDIPQQYVRKQARPGMIPYRERPSVVRLPRMVTQRA